MQPTFVQSHDAARAMLVATVIGAAVLEFVVTARERVETSPDGGLRGRARVVLATLVETTTLRTTGPSAVLANWLSLAILVVLPLLGHLPRIRVEETELGRTLGEPYRRVRRDEAATRARRLVALSSCSRWPRC